MATMLISEFNAIGQGAGTDIQIAHEPAVAHQSVTYTTATASAAFNAKTRFIKMYPSADCYVRFSTAGSAATTAHEFLKGTTDHWRAVEPTFKVNIYDGSS